MTLNELSIGNKGTYGIAASSVPKSDNLYTYLRITDINDDGTLNRADFKSVDDANADKYILKPNDIVFARTGGSTGRNYFYDSRDGTFVFAGFLIKFSINDNLVNPKYVKYFCQSQEYKGWVSSFNTGSTRGNINAQTYGNLEIPLIPREKQDELVGILSSIDDKIELNNKINDNLEKQAQAIFKSWFVDFEPFGGIMPADWVVSSLEDISSEIICGKTPSTKDKSNYGEDVPFITIPDMHNKTYIIQTERYLSINGADTQKNKFLPPNSICVSCIATAGLVTLTSELSQTNQQINSIIPKDSVSPYYLYLTMKSLSEHIKMLGSSGSTTNNLNKAQFSKIEVILPTCNIMKQFDEIISNIFKNNINISLENQKLAKLRDTLLPKLMSGKIDVSQVEI